jgi:hypothetical protein
MECGGKRYSARRRFLSTSAVAGWHVKAVPRPAHSAALVTAFQISSPRRARYNVHAPAQRKIMLIMSKNETM